MFYASKYQFTQTMSILTSKDAKDERTYNNNYAYDTKQNVQNGHTLHG